MPHDRATVPASDASAQKDPSTPLLFIAEHEAIAERRRVVLGPVDAAADAAAQALPRVGLALSGGGLRSATFGLGLVRGLAHHRDAEPASDDAPQPPPTLARDGLLCRFDYLSTVSGGGYIGAMLGRLIGTYGIHRAQALMRDADSPVLQWLRRNGRYLTPGGSRDTGIAVATYLRAWLAIHTEFLVACMLLGLVVIAPHLWQHTTQTLNAAGWEPWVTPWWPLAAASWAVTAPGLIAGYWAARDAPDPDARRRLPPLRDLLLLGIVAAGLVALVSRLGAAHAVDLRRDALDGTAVAVLALASGVLGQLATQLWLAVGGQPHALKVARLRNRLTRALRVVTLAALALAGLGALDALSWWVLEELVTGNPVLWSGIGLGGMAVLVLRTLVQPLQSMAAEAGAHSRRMLPRLVNVASLFGLLVLVTAWLVALQWFVFAPDTFEALRNTPAWLRAAAIAVVWAVWVLLTAGNAQMANASSLHNFYRARLTRAYVAVGNLRRRLGNDTSAQADVTVVVDGDDLNLADYHPEHQGGPIHLVSACLNQTRDDASGLYNADRKGAALTATWRGFEVGPSHFVPARPGQDTGTLGRWVAVSGAAASPGAGAYTSRGLALLVYFLGVRLGHWVRSPDTDVPLRWGSRFAWRFLPKPAMLASEASATFHGAERPWWYLSDGGHFDNTGVYALLKREAGFIVLSDAGCDADYRFADIENLVRKARIDFGADIEFYTRGEAARLFPVASADITVLSPEELADNHSCRGVLLARIRYCERPGADGRLVRPEATLLVVKPNLHDALDLDVLAYARQNPAFPHESIGDQSFDEAQWESYHRLGEDFGRALHPAWLAQLPGWTRPAQHPLRVAARLDAAVPKATVAPQPLWRRSARAAAIGTTLGLGATGTLLLSMWQLHEQVERNRSDQQAEARQLFADVSTGITAVDGACAPVPDLLVSQVSALLDLRGSPALRPLERAGLERLSARLTDRCTVHDAPADACPVGGRAASFADICAVALKPVTQGTALNYWRPARAAADEAVTVAQAVDRAAAPPTSAAPPPTVVTMEPARTAPLPAAVPAVEQACLRAGRPATLYVQIYDQQGLDAAVVLTQRLRAVAGASVRVAPVEDVGRTARLREQRQPARWAQPTFVLHDAASRPCALALAEQLGAPWVNGEVSRQVSVRELPPAMRSRRAGVIELWLPTGTGAAVGSGKP